MLLLICAGCGDKSVEPTNPVILNCPDDIVHLLKGDTYTHSFGVTPTDTCCKISWSVSSVGTPPHGIFAVNQSGQFVFSADSSDAGGAFTFSVTATQCGIGVGRCQVGVEVMNEEFFVVDISEQHEVYIGELTSISIAKTAGSVLPSAIDFLIAIDPSILTLESAQLGGLLLDQGWTDFHYSIEAVGTFGGPDLCQLVRITAFAPEGKTAALSHNVATENGELFGLQFRVEVNTTYNCSFTPIRFAWSNCDDNAVFTTESDHALMTHTVSAVDRYGNLADITGIDCDSGWDVNFGGSCPRCVTSEEDSTASVVDFRNGGIGVICWEEIGFQHGDLNGDGVADIDDAVIYIHYFSYGPRVFDIDLDRQIGASDANCDGICLSVADAWYNIIRIFRSAPPCIESEPFRDVAVISVTDGLYAVESSAQIQVVWMLFEADDDATFFSLLDGKNIGSRWDDGRAAASVSHRGNDIGDFLIVTGNATPVKIQVTDPLGNLLAVRLLINGKAYTDYGNGVVPLLW